MNDKDYTLIRSMVIETLVNDRRQSAGKRIPKDAMIEIEKLADEVVYKVQQYDAPKPAANPNAPLPGQISFDGEIVGAPAHPDPEWTGGLCRNCGGSGTVNGGDGRLRVNCPTCHGAGDQAEWDKRKAARENRNDATKYVSANVIDPELSNARDTIDSEIA